MSPLRVVSLDRRPDRVRDIDFDFSGAVYLGDCAKDMILDSGLHDFA
jgi:hypothetical protein